MSTGEAFHHRGLADGSGCRGRCALRRRDLADLVWNHLEQNVAPFVGGFVGHTTLLDLWTRAYYELRYTVRARGLRLSPSLVTASTELRGERDV